VKFGTEIQVYGQLMSVFPQVRHADVKKLDTATVLDSS